MADLWTHVGFARLAAFLGERAGLSFAPNRQPAAEAAIRRAMADAGIDDPLGFAREVERTAELEAAVLAEVTIGETYFFREPGQLDYVRETVLPTFRGKRSPSHPLRAWSAGCATGEEAYTLAIMLRELGFADSARVLGTDVSRPRLAAAERARYTAWSMRGVADAVVARYFIRRGKQFVLRPEIRLMADFRPLNLATDDYPGGRSGIGEMDLILCRNVLIYFDRPTVKAVAGRLLASLGEDGWLFLGASDPMLADLVPCETVVTGAGLAYRRAGAGGMAGVRRLRWPWDGEGAEWTAGSAGADERTAAGAERSGDPFAVLARPSGSGPAPGDLLPPEARDLSRGEAEGSAGREESGRERTSPRGRGAPPDGNVPPDTHDPATDSALAGADSRAGAAPTGATPSGAAPGARPEYEARYDARDYDVAATLAADAVGADPRDAAAWVTLVRSLANAGRSDDAERACASALARRPDSAPLAYLHAVLLARRGQHAAAAAAARRAVYLDRTLAVAQLSLGSSLARVGERDQARRAFRAAERLLARLPGDAPVPLADGESARRLAEAARAHRRRLEPTTT